MSSSAANDAPPAHHRRRRLLRGLAIAVAVVLVAVATVGYLTYRHLDSNITTIDPTRALGTDRPSAVVPTTPVPHQPLNILLIGSDTRKGQGKQIGGQTPGLSDTTILLHLSADRTRAYGVSIPRDSMVHRPSCLRKDGKGTDPGGLSMFNEAYAIGGPGCTERTVEQLTGIRLDHFVVVDFKGFKKMVDALHGVPVCVPKPVHDNVGHIDLPAGSYEVTGEQALNYVRVRHGISDNGDIGRMKRQQAFLAAMVNKAVSAGTLMNPVRLYSFLDAATKSLTTDPGLASLGKLADLAHQVRGIGLDQVQFLTVPFRTYRPDPNRLVWAPQAKRLWERLRNDQPLTPQQSKGVTTAAEEGHPHKTHHHASQGSPSASASGSASSGASAGASASAAAAAEQARENGLCG